MNLYEKIKKKDEKISIVGLGYVGMPLAISLAKRVDVIGFDLNEEKVQSYLSGHDVTNEVGDEALKITTAKFTTDPSELKICKFHIIAVPTPINPDKTPNLSPLVSASETVGKQLIPGSIVVYESTVFPGVTEDICIPILEKESGLKHGVDFKIGYSPERINPGDTKHRLETIIKVVAGSDEESLETIAQVYELIIEAGVYRAESIKVAEAAKVIENSQRDLNIAFMNELAIIFDKMNIDTKHVLEAAGTKWNFLNFSPGLVGGHCIGVDPYYLTYKSEMLGYKPEVILAGRRINDNMGKFIAEKTVKKLIESDSRVKGANILVMGLTFKENCPDLRNSKVIDVVNELKEYGINVVVTDPIANEEEAMHEYGVKLHEFDLVQDVDAIIACVAHDDYKSVSKEILLKKYKNNGYNKVLIDVKSIYNKGEFENQFNYWRL